MFCRVVILSPALRFEMKKATQQWSLRVTNEIVLNQIRASHEKLYVDNVEIIFSGL